MWGAQFQEFNLYPLTVKQNIALGVDSENINKEKISTALRYCEAENIINKLENGLDTELYKYFDSQGYEPSGGEAQRLAMARLFYHEFQMYILDEPSAAIDAQAEKTIFYALSKMTKNKTAFFISHRLSNVKFCDRILLIDSGKIVAAGNHASLMKHKYYSYLFNMQKESYVVKKAENL